MREIKKNSDKDSACIKNFRKRYFKVLIYTLRIFGMLPISFDFKQCESLQVRRHWKWYQYSLIFAFTVAHVPHFAKKKYDWQEFSFIISVSSQLAYAVTTISVLFLLLFGSKRICAALQMTLQLTSHTIAEQTWKRLFLSLCMEIMIGTIYPVLNWFSSGTFLGCTYMVVIAGFVIFYANIILVLNAVLVIANETLKEPKNSAIFIQENLQIRDRVLTVATKINSCCSIGNVMVTGMAFTEFLAFAFDIGYVGKLLEPTYLWSTFFLLTLLLLLIPPSLMSSQAKQTAWILYVNTLEDDSKDVRDTVEIFSLKHRHQDHRFRGGGVLILDMRLLCSLIGATITYGVLLIQFQGKKASSATDESSLIIAAGTDQPAGLLAEF